MHGSFDAPQDLRDLRLVARCRRRRPHAGPWRAHAAAQGREKVRIIAFRGALQFTSM
jgi:hypothetical protein